MFADTIGCEPPGKSSGARFVSRRDAPSKYPGVRKTSSVASSSSSSRFGWRNLKAGRSYRFGRIAPMGVPHVIGFVLAGLFADALDRVVAVVDEKPIFLSTLRERARPLSYRIDFM